jgi:hypothetical protein
MTGTTGSAQPSAVQLFVLFLTECHLLARPPACKSPFVGRTAPRRRHARRQSVTELNAAGYRSLMDGLFEQRSFGGTAGHLADSQLRHEAGHCGIISKSARRMHPPAISRFSEP